MKFAITEGPWFLSYKNPHKVCFNLCDETIQETQTLCIIHSKNVVDTAVISYLPILLKI